MSATRMTFGKYRGNLIHKLPSGYLLWVAENVDETGGHAAIVKACDEEWQFREKHNTHHEEEP